MLRGFFQSIFVFLFVFISAVSCDKKQSAKPPSAPQNLSIDQRDETSLTVSWEVPAEKGKHSDGKAATITNYIIYSVKGTDNAIRFSDFYGSVGNNLSAKIINLDKNQNYQLTVAAQNDAGLIGQVSPRVKTKTTSFGSSLDKQKDVALFLFLGDSNAEGFNDLATDEQITTTRLKNVYMFPRTKRTGTLSSTDWLRFTTTNTGMLGNPVSHKQTVLSEFATEWQRAIDAGNQLPDLYVINVSWAGQAIDVALTPNDKWAPTKELYSITTSALSHSIENLKKTGKRIRILPLFWMHGETDSKNETAANNYYSNLKEIFQGMDTSAGVDLSVAMVKLSTNDDKDTGSHRYKSIVNQKMKDLIDENPKRYILIDPLDNPDATAEPTKNKTTQGIFNLDGVHYNPSTVKWLSEYFLDRIFLDGYFGATIEP